jgi:L-ascorbate metabolism protein UlaG (beta-lactamase superfamily)
LFEPRNASEPYSRGQWDSALKATPHSPKGDVSYVRAFAPTARSGAHGFRSRRPRSLLTCSTVVGLGSIAGMLLLNSCARSFVHHGPVTLAINEYHVSDAVYVQWLGVSSWVISRGNDVVVTDPFFTRPSWTSVAVSLLFPRIGNNFGYDIQRINDVLPRLPANTKFVLISHAHYDHLMDVPYYMKQESAPNVTYVGGQTANNILTGFKPVNVNFIVPQEGRSFEKGNVRVTAFKSDHAPHMFRHKLMAGEVKEPMSTFPVTVGEYVEGETLVYFIDFLDVHKNVSYRVFVNGAASTPHSAKSLGKHRDFLLQHPTNVAILCVPGWDKVEDYPNSLLRLIKPDNVVLSHYDNFGLSYKNGEDPKKDMRYMIFADYAGFVEKRH